MLGYVDDVTVLEASTDLRQSVETASDRVSGMARACRELADQSMNANKCHSLVIQLPEAVSPTTHEDVLALDLRF